ncbi:MAG: copper resistance protein CopC [Actinomycetota bacterium]|nr:copper resistance protein CopC [Actinomycetota bacterium]
MSAVCRILVVAALVSLTGVVGAPAEARNNPIAASPAVRQTVAQAPSSVTLAMKNAVKGPAVISVTGPDGKVVSQPATTILSTNIAVDLNTGLAKGTYTVKYRIEGPDGPEGGTYQFAYGSGKFSVKGITTWGGYKEIPKPLRLKDDDKRAAAAASATPTPTPTEPTPTATAPTDDATEGAAATNDDSSLVSSATEHPLWLAAGLAAIAGALLALFAWRKVRVGGSDTIAP